MLLRSGVQSKQCLSSRKYRVVAKSPRHAVKMSVASEEKSQSQNENAQKAQTRENISAEDTTKKFGLEAGLWKAFTDKSKENGENKSSTAVAGELLKKYGGSYIVTSVTLALISFSLFYTLFSVGTTGLAYFHRCKWVGFCVGGSWVDVPGLLSKVGIKVDGASGQVSTVAVAYAAHKAASPIRFPPTVALTPVVANWLSKLGGKEDKGGGQEQNEKEE